MESSRQTRRGKIGMMQGERDLSEGARGGARLRVLLLAGLALAVIVPFGLFAWLGNLQLRRATKEGLGRHLMVSEARGTADRVASSLARARELVESACATPALRARFADTPAARNAFAIYHSRVSELFGSMLLVARAPVGGEARVVFPEGLDAEVSGPDRFLLQSWLASAGDPSPRLHEPIQDPFLRAGTVSSPRDPGSWVLPLIVPISDDTQVGVGVCVVLLPLVQLQEELERTQRWLVERAELPSGEAWIVDRASLRYLLHTERDKIGQRAERAELDGFLEAGGMAHACAALDQAGLPAWSVGVDARAAELFRSVDTLSGFFLILVVLVLTATLGIGALISLGATRSLSRLEQTTASLGAGDLSVRAQVAGPREVRTLAQEFNRMAQRLQEEQERVKHAERDRAWTKMARQVAHEIKNPLQPVRLHAELIARIARGEDIDAAAAGRVGNSAAVILRQVDALRRIVADFSEYALAALPLRERVRFRASEVLAELVGLYSVLEGDSSLRVVFEDRSGDAELLGSPLRLQQVLVNLVKNALEATEDREHGDREPVELSAWVEGDAWIVVVRDRGHGLPDGGAQQAFEPSFSTKAGGTGLGLAICQRNVDAMDGQIELVPRDGGGAMARVRLPLA